MASSDDERQPDIGRHRLKQRTTSEGAPADAASAGRRVPPDLNEATIARVVDVFYERARADDLIGPIFNRVVPPDQWPRHLVVIADFWSAILLGTGRYGGRPLAKHVPIVDLADRHFDRWLELFAQTVTTLCSEETAAIFIDRSQRIAATFRSEIARRRGQPAPRGFVVPNDP